MSQIDLRVYTGTSEVQLARDNRSKSFKCLDCVHTSFRVSFPLIASRHGIGQDASSHIPTIGSPRIRSTKSTTQRTPKSTHPSPSAFSSIETIPASSPSSTSSTPQRSHQYQMPHPPRRPRPPQPHSRLLRHLRLTLLPQLRQRRKHHLVLHPPSPGRPSLALRIAFPPAHRSNHRRPVHIPRRHKPPARISARGIVVER